MAGSGVSAVTSGYSEEISVLPFWSKVFLSTSAKLGVSQPGL